MNNKPVNSFIGVYKTTVQKKGTASEISEEIRRTIPACDVSFDLEDCDNVLRIEIHHSAIDENIIKKILRKHGHLLETLPV